MVVVNDKGRQRDESEAAGPTALERSRSGPTVARES